MGTNEFHQKKAELKRRAPNHPLIDAIEEVHSILTEIYLTTALDELPEEEMEAEEENQVDKVNYEIIGESNPVLDALYQDQRKRFTERRKWSNKFHECRTDAERKKISEELVFIQQEIKTLMQRTKHFKEFGFLPSEADKYPIPKDSGDLQRLINSLRSSISRKKRQIETEAAIQAPGWDEKTKTHQLKLTDLKNHLEHAQKAQKDRNI